jgi:hypothetical protein
MVLAGDLAFNPMTDALTGADGKQFKLKSPYGDELPARGFDAGEDTYQPPAADGSKVSVVVDPTRCTHTHTPHPIPSPTQHGLLLLSLFVVCCCCLLTTSRMRVGCVV